MSLLGGGFGRPGGGTPAGTVNDAKVELAMAELTAVSQLYNTIQKSCYSKCINKKFYEEDLTTGEAVCLDRCVSKFFATHQKMNEVLMKISQQNTGIQGP